MAKAIKCFVCRHPNRLKIDAALKAGMTHREIVRTLCPDIQRYSVGRHFRLDHHKQEPGADWTPVTTNPTIRTKSTIKGKATKRTPATSGEIVKVHWELPRDLVKQLKHAAVDAEVPVVELVRDLLRRGV